MNITDKIKEKQKRIYKPISGLEYLGIDNIRQLPVYYSQHSSTNYFLVSDKLLINIDEYKAIRG